MRTAKKTTKVFTTAASERFRTSAPMENNQLRGMDYVNLRKSGANPLSWARLPHEEVLDAMQARRDAHPDTMQVHRDAHPDTMRVRWQTVEHPFETLKAWMGATHFVTKTLPRVRTEI
jgi:hypothetical protein